VSAQRTLVTGATGFLGAHVVAALVQREREVVALVREPDSKLARSLSAQPGVTLATGDVLDQASVEAAAKGCSAVMHCAGKVSRASADASMMTRVNVEGVATVLAACERAGVDRVVLASTSGTIGVSTDPDAVADETSPTPLELINKWPYYRSKYYGERIALDFVSSKARQRSFELVTINPALLLGPGDMHGSSTEDVRRALEMRMPVVPSGGVAFVDARDAAEGMVLALDKGRDRQRYLLVACNCPVSTFYSRVARVAESSRRVPRLIGDGAVFSLPDHVLVKRATRWLVKRAHEVLGQDDALPDAVSIEMAQHYWYVDSTLAENELGWRPRDPMITLADTVADLRARGVVMMRSPD
jgi:dihydroflavonol-4-reductase